MEKTRRRLLQAMAATGLTAGIGTLAGTRAQGMQPDLILRNGQFTTLDRSNPQADAVAIKDGRFMAVGLEREVMPLAGSGSKVIDLKSRRAVPGLIDSHTHIIRGGLNYNMELRWDGVRSLADAMTMLKRQVAATPPPQWVRVVGGFTERQFAEKRLPTIDELNAVAPYSAKYSFSSSESSRTSIQRTNRGMVCCAGIQNRALSPSRPVTSPAVQLPRVWSW